jgi:hypothetical protein
MILPPPSIPHPEERFAAFTFKSAKPELVPSDSRMPPIGLGEDKRSKGLLSVN